MFLCFLTLHWPRGTVRTNTYMGYRFFIEITQLYIFGHSTVESSIELRHTAMIAAYVFVCLLYTGARPLQMKMKKKMSILITCEMTDWKFSSVRFVVQFDVFLPPAGIVPL